MERFTELERQEAPTSLTHAASTQILLSEAVLYVTHLLSPSSFPPASILLWLIAILARLNSTLCSAFVAISYVLFESGSAVLSIIEPAHSSEVYRIWSLVFFLKVGMGRTPAHLVKWLLACVKLRENSLVKLAKLILLATPNARALYISYIGLRNARWLITLSDAVFDGYIFMAIVLWICVRFRGGWHATMADVMLLCTSLHKLSDWVMELAIKRGVWSSSEFFGEDTALNLLATLTIRNVCDAPWNDVAHEDLVDENEDIFHENSRAGTETAVTRLLAEFLEKVGRRIRGRRQSNDDVRFTNNVALVAITEARLVRLALGVRDIGVRTTRPPGTIFRLTNSYTPFDDRVEAAAKLLLGISSGAAVSYRHCETLEQSCAKIERLVSETNIEVLWADVFLKEITRVDDFQHKWVEIGLEPYIYVEVLREPHIEDGDVRLWLALEGRLSKRVWPGPSEYNRHSILLLMYYWTGRVLMLEAYRLEDVTEAAAMGLTIFRRIMENIDSFGDVTMHVSVSLYLSILDIFEGEYSSQGSRVLVTVPTDHGDLCKMREVLREAVINGMYKLAVEGEEITGGDNELTAVRVQDSGTRITFEASVLRVVYRVFEYPKVEWKPQQVE